MSHRFITISIYWFTPTFGFSWFQISREFLQVLKYQVLVHRSRYLFSPSNIWTNDDRKANWSLATPAPTTSEPQPGPGVRHFHFRHIKYIILHLLHTLFSSLFIFTFPPCQLAALSLSFLMWTFCNVLYFITITCSLIWCFNPF